MRANPKECTVRIAKKMGGLVWSQEEILPPIMPSKCANAFVRAKWRCRRSYLPGREEQMIATNRSKARKGGYERVWRQRTNSGDGNPPR
jgi:hypothetical protein